MLFPMMICFERIIFVSNSHIDFIKSYLGSIVVDAISIDLIWDIYLWRDGYLVAQLLADMGDICSYVACIASKLPIRMIIS